MNNPSIALQTAYYDALTNPPIYIGGTTWAGAEDEFGLSDLVWAGNVVEVFSDMTPTATGFNPYIVLGQQTFIDDADKTVFGSEATQNVTVVTSFQSDVGGKKLSSEIADQVLQRIRVRARLPMLGFNMITSTLDSYLTLNEQTATATLIRAEIRFRHIIEELDVTYLVDDNGNFLTDQNNNFLTL